MKITAEFGKSAATAWGAYANKKFVDAVEAGDEDTAECWAPDGMCRAGGHAVIGGLCGGVSGAVGAATSSLTAPAFLSVLTEIGIPNGVAEGLTAAYATGMGALTGGSAGAAGGFNEAANNNNMAARLILGSIEIGGPNLVQMCLQSPQCVGIVGKAALETMLATTVNTNGGPTMGDINPGVFGGAEAGLPADTYGTPPDGGVPPPDEDNQRASEKRFDYSGVDAHSGKRLRAEGITTKEAEAAVQADIDRRIIEGTFRVSNTRSISYETTIRGKSIEYRLIQRPDGSIRVGTIFPK